ncbi:pentatricopeptide repeat-containing protein At1g09190 [Benincasa hispida]|uniref:pentatricopeptide repeat-containing protein At1g09190 n=1 Tax=Benincasa hispida TaxID=102211 RepID=UPI00190278C9|nr:pentatricopeptide repeat-containing protein At1g09190 [Benincasa hispida]
MNKNCLEIERRILRLLHGEKSRTHLTEIHAHFLRHGLHQSNQILAHFISICAAFNHISYASRLFSQSHNPNIFLFNSIIKAHSLCPPFQQSLLLFSSMKNHRIVPDEYTFAPLLKSCANLREYSLGQCVIAEVLRRGFYCFGSIRIGVVELYVCCERMEDARKVFDEMPHRDVVVWNLMIRGFCKMGNVDFGLYLFRQMNERSLISWNTMLSCLAQSRCDAEALELFQQMEECGFKPDEVTVVTMLPVCSRLGALDVGQRIHNYASSKGDMVDNTTIGNSLVDFYCKCGNVERAYNIFQKMTCKSVVSWNTMILGFALNGNGEFAIDLFMKMGKEDVKPNDATFVAVLTACVHSGLLEKGRELFSSMADKYEIQPKLEHFGCMVDLLGRGGCLEEAHNLIKSMPMQPNATLWGALLGACRTHGNLKLAEMAVKELSSLEPWNSGNYVLLSNMLAEEGRWEDVENVRRWMKGKSVKKAPGQSASG